MNQHQLVLILEKLNNNIKRELAASWLPDTRQVEMITRSLEKTIRQLKGETE